MVLGGVQSGVEFPGGDKGFGWDMCVCVCVAGLAGKIWNSDS